MVDLWAGRDVIGVRRDTGDSISILMSVSKGMTATGVHLLAERGQVGVEAPAAANGKQHVTVRHLLTHSAGLFGFPSRLAGMAPLWEQGTPFAYRARHRALRTHQPDMRVIVSAFRSTS